MSYYPKVATNNFCQSSSIAISPGCHQQPARGHRSAPPGHGIGVRLCLSDAAADHEGGRGRVRLQAAPSVPLCGAGFRKTLGKWDVESGANTEEVKVGSGRHWVFVITILQAGLTFSCGN